MELKSVFIVVLVLVGVALAQEKCCFPEQFEIKEGTETGFVEKGRGSAITTFSDAAFDKTNKRIGSLSVVLHEGNATFVQVIQDYEKGEEYRILESLKHCQKLPLSEKFPACVPDEAKYEGAAYLGDHKLTLDSFSLTVKEKEAIGQGTMTVTAGDCIPNSESFSGVIGKVSLLSLAGFYNYTSGIKDPSKFFTVPDFCPKSFTKGPKIHPLVDSKLMR